MCPSLISIKLTGLSVVDVRRSCQPLRTGSSRRWTGLDRDWYISAVPNQGHAGEDGGPQIDGCESEYEHGAAMGTRSDLHLMLEERMLLIGTDVKADVIGLKTFIERNAYLISVHQRAAVLGRGSGEDDADSAGGVLAGDATGSPAWSSESRCVTMRSDSGTSKCLTALSPERTAPLIVAMTFLLISRRMLAIN
jgi:hypothetical protein